MRSPIGRHPPRERGFTLIELMIVCACLGIVMTALTRPILLLRERYATETAELAVQQAATAAFVVLERAFARATAVECPTADEIRLLGGTPTTIRWRPGGSLAITSPTATKTIAAIPGGFSFGTFTALDRQTVSMSMRLGAAKFPMVWRCGR